MKTFSHLWQYLTKSFSEWAMFKTTIVEQIKTHFMFNNFFPKIIRRDTAINALILIVKYSLFLSNFNETNLLNRFFEKHSATKFYKNPSGGSRVVPCGQTDWQPERHNEIKFLFAILRTRPKSVPIYNRLDMLRCVNLHRICLTASGRNIHICVSANSANAKVCGCNAERRGRNGTSSISSFLEGKMNTSRKL
jgi:hypothetical protein